MGRQRVCEAGGGRGAAGLRKGGWGCGWGALWWAWHSVRQCSGWRAGCFIPLTQVNSLSPQAPHASFTHMQDTHLWPSPGSTPLLLRFTSTWVSPGSGPYPYPFTALR